MYTEVNYKTKKELVEAVARNERVTLQAPLIGERVFNGTEWVEGPHAPAPHSWYAKVTVKDGLVVKVK